MEQLVLKTQQPADVKIKKSVKGDMKKENEADFGKALEQFAAYSQQPEQTEQTEVQLNDSSLDSSSGLSVEGIFTIQTNGMVGMLNLEDWAKAQGVNVGKEASADNNMQLQDSALLSPVSQDSVLSNVEMTGETVNPVNIQNDNLIKVDVQITGTEIKADNSEIPQAAQLNGKGSDNLQTDVLSKVEENGDVTVKAETDEKDVVTDALSSNTQEYRVEDTQIKGIEENSQTAKMKPEYADMLKDMIAKQVSAGKQELEIRLTPRSLGDLIVKVTYQDGAAAVSIICSDKKALQAMSQRAGELGMILENNLGSRTEVVVETREEHTNLYEDGRGQQSYNGQQSSKEQHSNSKQNETETIDFLQQLRLGIRKESEYIWQ